MNSLHDVGEAMILAQEGQLQFAALLRAGIARLWMRGMGQIGRMLNRTANGRSYTG